MRILTLIENTAATEKLFIEHGLSFYIEHGRTRILFDTGASEKFAKNAERMMVDLSGLSAAVLSHNHISHTGGLDELFRTAPNVRVFAKSSIVGEFYRQSGIFRVPLSISSAYFEKYSDSFILFANFQEIVEGVYLMSNEVFDEDFYSRDKTLYMRRDGKGVRDDFAHELFMVIFPSNTPEGGCVIISPCSHAGIVNIIRTVKRTWPNAPIKGVVGGFHFMGAGGKLVCPPDHLEEIANELISLDVGQIYTCHCTGQRGYERLKVFLGDQLQYLQTGEELEF